MHTETRPTPTHTERQPHEHRASPRVDVESEITLVSEDNFYQGFSENISEGGLFVVTYQPHRVGDVITVRFTLPGVERTLEARAEVRWVREGAPDRDVAPGLGVRFVELADDDRACIERFVRHREPMFYEE